MTDERTVTNAHDSSELLLRLGGVAAIIGTILQVGAGALSTSLPGETGEAALPAIAANSNLPPLIYLGFILGAVLWVWALVALACQLQGKAWTLGLLAAVSGIMGATLHAVDGVLHGVALPRLAMLWTTTPEDARGGLAQGYDLLTILFTATWAGVIVLFHGVPFVLAGLAIMVSQRFPVWLGWIALIGGAGSVIVGLGMFFGLAPAGLAVPFAVVISVAMVVLGWLMWTSAHPTSERAMSLEAAPR